MFLLNHKDYRNLTMASYEFQKCGNAAGKEVMKGGMFLCLFGS
jgi:hypothetical protein